MSYYTDLNKFREREKEIMKALKSHPLIDVARMFGMNYQRIQQIRKRALKRNGKVKK